MGMISFSRRLTALADADPDRPAVTCGQRSLTRAQLESAANRLARDLGTGGVGLGDMVTIALPNSTDWFVAVAACWKLGAIPQPVSARLPEPELSAILELADPPAVIGVPAHLAPGRRTVPAGYQPDPALPDGPLPDITSPAWKAPTSGGSTGRPKLIVSGDPAATEEDAPPLFGVPGGCMVMPAPLYHNGPIVWSCSAWLAGSHVVVLPRFDAEATLAAIDHYRGDTVYLVPTMMKRIWRLLAEVRDAYDMSSLQAVWHLAEPCPEWLKQVWIDWLGPDRIFELYAGTEAQAVTIITGTEWLAHRGSVGRPAPGTVVIRDAEGNELPAGEQGEVWLHSLRAEPTYRYVGAAARTLPGGWESLGDMGWLDEDGYLYLGDRLQDMILTGGANVYPAEVEAALAEHAAVRSAAVIGLPDADMGNIVHAIVEADAETVSEDELLAFAAERIARYKVPRSIEYTDLPLRDDAGKLRRGALRAQRVR
ncbi:MAG TPA: AMP-binding protein [Streptosporangiaceae bacterium]|nr:AMP-binding protein [Streptosporangiaceae bacterium]